jgi:acyl-CoA dehydrogenase
LDSGSNHIYTVCWVQQFKEDVVEAFYSYSGWLMADSGGALFLWSFALMLCGYFGAPLWAWSALALAGVHGFGFPTLWFGIALGILLVLNIYPVRQILITAGIMRLMRAMQLIPKISATERAALEAGVVWMEAELFSGMPNFKKMLQQPVAKLTSEEQSFLDNETEELCSMLHDWEMFRTRQIPAPVLEFIKKKGFLGLIIPKEYGGLGFSPAANSAIVQKLASRSVGGVIYVMVPNSLGPAELLNHYGTMAQKNKYLPRLARGDEVPCFGLTEPTAGSDAASIVSDGVLFKGADGEICIRLNWRKRWITLASISTLIGVAFRLRDPEKLLGGSEDVGITTALIPSNLPGVMIGKRHDPLGIPFHNCPTEGRDVIVKAEEAIIGGIANAGKGWKMLMESLGAGRGISLPAQSAGGTKLFTRVAFNHAAIRKQFGLPIGRFEGVEEPLARIAGGAYYTEALRRYVLSALNQHISPPVVTAIAKFAATETARKSVNDAMDILGGAGISMGPRNVVAATYIASPIAITVEGANILTRTLMIFGQGALRAHPYAFKEVNAIEKNDLRAFDRAFWGHMGHIVRNMIRAFVLSATRGYLARTPVWGGGTRRYWQKLAWCSASFAILTDLAMGLLGGKLKTKEKLTGRFADILSWMFIASSVLKRWEDEGRQKDDWSLVQYSMALAFSSIQDAFDGLYANLDVPIVSLFMRGPIRWWSRVNMLASPPRDRLTHQMVKTVMKNLSVRDRLTEGMYLPTDRNEALGRLEYACTMVRKAEAVDKKIRDAIRSKKMPKKKGIVAIEEAFKIGAINAEEHATILEAEKLRIDAIQVDEFHEHEYLPGGYQSAQAPVKPFVTGLWAAGPTREKAI